MSGSCPSSSAGIPTPLSSDDGIRDTSTRQQMAIKRVQELWDASEFAILVRNSVMSMKKRKRQKTLEILEEFENAIRNLDKTSDDLSCCESKAREIRELRIDNDALLGATNFWKVKIQCLKQSAYAHQLAEERRIAATNSSHAHEKQETLRDADFPEDESEKKPPEPATSVGSSPCHCEVQRIVDKQLAEWACGAFFGITKMLMLISSFISSLLLLSMFAALCANVLMNFNPCVFTAVLGGLGASFVGARHVCFLRVQSQFAEGHINKENTLQCG